jgi:hypothetical protein
LTKQRVPWRRLLTEGFTIVASILLAFAIDAAWEERQEATEVTEGLRAIRSELVANREYFEVIESFHRRVAEGGLEMLSITGPDPSREAAERAPFLIGELWVRAGLERPSTGALEAIVASGRLSKIDDAELRQELSAFSNYMDRQFELIDIIGAENRFYELMVTHVAQLDIDLINGMGVFAEAREEFVARAPAASRFESDYEGLLADREFENAVTSRTTQSLIGTELTRQARGRIDSLSLLLDAEIG